MIYLYCETEPKNLWFVSLRVSRHGRYKAVKCKSTFGALSLFSETQKYICIFYQLPAMRWRGEFTITPTPTHPHPHPLTPTPTTLTPTTHPPDPDPQPPAPPHTHTPHPNRLRQGTLLVNIMQAKKKEKYLQVRRTSCIRTLWLCQMFTAHLFEIKLHLLSTVLSYSVDFKAPGEPWNPLSKAVPDLVNFPGLVGIVNAAVYKTEPIFTGLGHGKLS